MSVFLGAEPRTHSCWQFERAEKRRPVVQKRFPDDSITSSLIGWTLSLELDVAASGARRNVIPSGVPRTREPHSNKVLER